MIFSFVRFFFFIINFYLARFYTFWPCLKFFFVPYLIPNFDPFDPLYEKCDTGTVCLFSKIHPWPWTYMSIAILNRPLFIILNENPNYVIFHNQIVHTHNDITFKILTREVTDESEICVFARKCMVSIHWCSRASFLFQNTWYISL